jgi:hypothetical protein
MSAHFAIHHHTDSPAYYDIIIDREQAISIFRIVQFDMLAFLDGSEVKAEEIDPGSADKASLDIPAGCGKGTVRLFDAGSCAIEQWSPPVYIIQITSRQFSGTLHILKVEEGYSLRYLRNRLKKPPLR